MDNGREKMILVFMCLNVRTLSLFNPSSKKQTLKAGLGVLSRRGVCAIVRERENGTEDEEQTRSE